MSASILTPFKILGDKLKLWDLVILRHHDGEVCYGIARTNKFGDRVAKGLGSVILEDGGVTKGPGYVTSWRYYDDKKHKASQVVTSLSQMKQEKAAVPTDAGSLEFFGKYQAMLEATRTEQA